MFWRKNLQVRSYLVFFLALILSMVLFRRLAVFLLVSSGAGLLTFIIYRLRLPFDVSPTLFLSLMVSREYGLAHSIVFIVISGILPMVFAGGSFDHTTLFYSGIRIAANALNTLMIGLPLKPALLLMALFDHTIGTLGSVTLFSANPAKELVNFSVQLGIDLFYIVTFAGILSSALG